MTFGRAADVVVEGNHFADVQVAICLSNRTGRLSLARQGLLLRNNDFHNMCMYVAKRLAWSTTRQEGLVLRTKMLRAQVLPQIREKEH